MSRKGKKERKNEKDEHIMREHWKCENIKEKINIQEEELITKEKIAIQKEEIISEHKIEKEIKKINIFKQ